MTSDNTQTVYSLLAENEWLKRQVGVLRSALMQILDDGQHISDYVGPNEAPVFNRNGRQGSYCYAAAEQAMDALAAAEQIENQFNQQKE